MKYPSLVLLAGLLVSCSNPEGDFKQAEQANTEQAYTEFIAKHPQSPRVAEARARIEKNAYDTADRAATVSAYEAFAKRFATSDLAKKAEGKVEAIEFTQAVATASLSGWAAFLQKHPESTNSRGAQAAITRLEYDAAVMANNIADYEGFLSRHPDSEFATDVKPRLESQLEERDWNQTLLKDKVEAYLKFHELHPSQTRIKVLQGTIRASVSYGFSASPFGGSMKSTGLDVRVTIDEHPDLKLEVPPEDAARFNLMTYEPMGGVARVGEKPAVTNATILLLRSNESGTGTGVDGVYKLIGVTVLKAASAPQ